MIRDWHSQTLVKKLQRRSSFYLNKKTFTLPEMKPIISFTFDDFLRSAYRIGGAILKAYNTNGTYYTAMGLMDAETELGQHFSVHDLYDLVDDGHELACHTFSHVDCVIISAAMREADVIKNRRQVEALLPDTRLRNFAYPFGRVSPSAKRIMGRHFASCRGINKGINTGRVDLNLLRANALYSNTIDLRDVERLIRENERVKGWLIFYTHDVCDTPSDWGCTSQYFEAVVKCAAASQSEILTIDHVLSVLGSHHV